MAFFEKNLREGEEVIAVLKKSKAAFAWKYIIAVVFIFLASFLLFPLFNWGSWGKYIWMVLAVIAVFYLLKLFAMTATNCLILTDQRVINFRRIRIFDQRVSEVDISDVGDVSYRIKGIRQKMFNSGDLKIIWNVSGDDKKMIVKFLKNPEKVQRLILDLVKHSHGKGPKQEESYQETLLRIQKDIGKETLLKLVKSLKDDEIDDEEEEEQAELVPEDEEAEEILADMDLEEVVEEEEK